MNRILVDLPSMADGEQLDVIEVLVEQGEEICSGQPLVTVESSSRATELPSPCQGVIASVEVRVGDRVSAGSQLVAIDTEAAPAASGLTHSQDELIAVPDIGDFEDVTVIEVMVKPGDVIVEEQSLITVESDKASMEIPAPRAGAVKEVLVKVGDKVSTGAAFLVMLKEATENPSSDEPTPQPEQSTSMARVVAARNSLAEPSAFASPSVRKSARERGVPIGDIKGSGFNGRVTHEDVQQFGSSKNGGASGVAALGLIPWPKVDFTKFGEIERKDLSRIKKISGANLHRNWVMIPHVTNHDDCDITELEAFRVAMNKENEKAGVKLTMLAFMIKASVAALRRFPEFNSSLEGDQLVLKKYFHIGFAVDTPNGLMVPVIKDADKKGVIQISQEMGELAKKARDGKLGPADMSGACFTISSLGGIGGRYFTPIINAPEVAIMGVCKSQIEPKWDGKAFVPKLMLPLSLSWDHRVIDGAAAARFNAFFGQVLADFRRVLL
ncbi:dihydrolipoyllysine-residue acetyltransferase [Variovorax ureilyticus]|uniref:Acetyltransferase component of pyruvate dehydrogenase complex n=1 Tax=Variovorax ureilyticus TaxID=1836198 RepID=A0ABU8VNW5_9BURK